MTSRYSSRPIPTVPPLPRSAQPMVADVVTQDVVAGVVQRPVLGEEVDLESAQAAELRQMARIPVAISGQEVVVDDQLVGPGRHEPSFERDTVHRRKGHVFEVEADFTRTTQHWCAPPGRRAGHPHVQKTVERCLALLIPAWHIFHLLPSDVTGPSRSHTRHWGPSPSGCMICPPLSDFTDEPRRRFPDLALRNRSKAAKLGARSAGYCCGWCGSTHPRSCGMTSAARRSICSRSSATSRPTGFSRIIWAPASMTSRSPATTSPGVPDTGTSSMPGIAP